MSLNNPSNLYSEGNVSLDSSPYTRVFLQREAKKKALDDAANNFFSRMPDKINAAGVRQQDLVNPENPNQGIMADIQGMRQYWQQNKEEIKKGGRAQQDYLNLNQQLLRKIDQSKQRGKTTLEIGKAKFEGKFNPRESDLPVLDKINASIYSPKGYKEDSVTEYGLQDLSPSVPRFDAAKQRKLYTVAFGTAKPVYDENGARVDNVTGEVFIPKKYDDKTIKIIGENAGEAVQGDLSAKYYYEDLLDDAVFVDKANKAYQQFYGSNEQVDTPKKAAIADYLMKAQASAGEEKVKDVNYAQKLKLQFQEQGFKNRLKSAGYNDYLISRRMDKAHGLKKLYYDYSQSQGAKNEEGIVTKYINIQKKDAVPQSYVTINGERFGAGKFIQPTVTIADKFKVNRDTPDGKYTEEVKPDAFYLTDDGKSVIPVKFKRDANGKVLKSATGASLMDNRGFQPIPMQNYRTEVSKEIVQKKNQGPEIIDEFVGDDDPAYSEHLRVVETEGSSSSNGVKEKAKKRKISW